jgi:acyl carrier protein
MMVNIDAVLQVARETLNDIKLTAASKLEDAEGFDSMAYVQLMIDLEAQFNINLADENIPRTSTIEEVFEIIKRQLNYKES